MLRSDNILDREVLDVIREQYDHIFWAEKKVADFVLKYPQKAGTAYGLWYAWLLTIK